MKRKILFQKWGGFSLINDSIFKILQAEFKGHSIDVIDVRDLSKENIHFYHYLVNLYYFGIEYGPDFILGHKKWKDIFSWFFSTSYMSLQMSKYLRLLASGSNYQFSFQTQGLFNGKIKGIPHFIYTDHTTKTNLL